MENLDNDQKDAIIRMKQGQNVFLTGGGGTGKSFVLEHFICYLKNKYNEDWKRYVGITSLTGSSALLIGGTTIHSFSGIGVSKLDDNRIIETISKRKYIKNRWKELKTLIIDEISMITPRTFRLLNKLAQFIRKNNLPFGGIQMIFSGDFCQLSPILEQHLLHTMDYCFETPEWKEANIYTVYFKQIHRQSDLEFIDTLQKIRLGISDQETSSVLMSRFKKSLENKNGILPTQLYPTRDRANSVNSTFLEKLKKMHDTKTFSLNISVEQLENGDERLYNNEILEQKILSQTPVPKTIELCKDLQVILVINLSIDEGLVNGSKGIITDFDDKGFPIVSFLNGKVRVITPYTWDIEENGMIVKAVGIPLILGYGCTIHRSQGMTIELAIIDIGNNIFIGSGGYGQVYVALSRVRSLSGLSILNFDPNRIKCHPKVIRYYEDLEKEIIERNKQNLSNTIKPLNFTLMNEPSSQPLPIKKVIKKSKEELKTRQFNIHTFFNPTVPLE
jgi:ATP-dependent DNA helicase PIF1